MYLDLLFAIPYISSDLVFLENIYFWWRYAKIFVFTDLFKAKTRFKGYWQYYRHNAV